MERQRLESIADEAIETARKDVSIGHLGYCSQRSLYKLIIICSNQELTLAEWLSTSGNSALSDPRDPSSSPMEVTGLILSSDMNDKTFLYRQHEWAVHVVSASGGLVPPRSFGA